jgi:hypothetical protein
MKFEHPTWKNDTPFLASALDDGPRLPYKRKPAKGVCEVCGSVIVAYKKKKKTRCARCDFK